MKTLTPTDPTIRNRSKFNVRKYLFYIISIFFIISVGTVPTVLTMSVASSVAEVCSVKAVALVSDTKAMLRHARVGHGKGKGILKGKKAKE